MTLATQDGAHRITIRPGSVDDFEVEEGQPIIGTYTLTCEHVEKLNTALLDRYKDQKNVITTPLVRGSVLLCGALGSPL